VVNVKFFCGKNFDDNVQMLQLLSVSSLGCENFRIDWLTWRILTDAVIHLFQNCL